MTSAKLQNIFLTETRDGKEKREKKREKTTMTKSYFKKPGTQDIK